MLQHVMCHLNKEAIHNKTTYKLSTATSVTSFMDTFFCSIIWTISPVGKHMTFYFQHKPQHTLSSVSEFNIPTLACASCHILQLFLQPLPSITKKPDTSSHKEKEPSACPNLCLNPQPFRQGKFGKIQTTLQDVTLRLKVRFSPKGNWCHELEIIPVEIK